MRKLKNYKIIRLEEEKIRKLGNEEMRKLENKRKGECHPELFFMQNLPLETLLWLLDFFCQCVCIATYVPKGEEADRIVTDAINKLAKLVLQE